MFFNLSSDELWVAGFVLIVASYFIGIAMNGVMGEDGFGAIGNMCVLIAGGALGAFLATHLGYVFFYPQHQAAVVVAGAFAALAILAVFKAVLIRLGY